MAANFHEQFHDEVERPSDRSTGFVFAALALVLAVVYRHHALVLPAGVSVAVILAAVSLLAPLLLRPLNLTWFAFGQQLQKIVRPVAMAVLFFFVVVPLGYFMRLRYDPLRAKVGSGFQSFWISRDGSPSGEGMTASMKHQF